MTILLISFVLLCFLFVLGKLYSEITGKTSSDLLKLTDVNESIKNKGGFWFLLIPITAFLLLIYNFVLTAVWFLMVALGWFAKLVNWITSALKWIWIEVIIAAVWRLLKVAFHYFIYLPWSVFKAAFESILAVLDFKVFRISLMGIFISALITILGRYLILELKMPDFVFQVFLAISILPIGFSIASVLWHKAPDGFNKANNSINYLRHAATLITLFCGVFLLGMLFVYLGSYTGLKYILSSLLVGSSLISSGFIIFSALLLLFLLSALPSYSLTNEKPTTGFLKGYFNYLLNKWYHYLLTMPAAIIPVIIVCALPMLLSKGAAYVSQEVTEKVYEQRIKATDSRVQSLGTIGDYKSWTDMNTVSDDSLKKLTSADFAQLEIKQELNSLKLNAKNLNENYRKFSSPKGAATVGLLILSYNQYEKANQHITDSKPYELKETEQNFNGFKKSIDNNSLELQAEEKQVKERLSLLNEQLSKVCDTTTTRKYDEPVKEVAAKEDEPKVDYCELQRKEINKEIETASQKAHDIEIQMARNKAVSDHLQAINDKWDSMQAQQHLSAKVSNVLVTIWLALLWAISLSLGLSLYAILCGRVHLIDKDKTKWFFVEQIEEARSINSNQPLLGFTILTLALILFFGANSLKSTFLSSLSKDTMSEIIKENPIK